MEDTGKILQVYVDSLSCMYNISIRKYDDGGGEIHVEKWVTMDNKDEREDMLYLKTRMDSVFFSVLKDVVKTFSEGIEIFFEGIQKYAGGQDA